MKTKSEQTDVVNKNYNNNSSNSNKNKNNNHDDSHLIDSIKCVYN